MTGGLDGDRDVLLRNRHALDELAVNIVDLREARSRLRKTMEQIQRRRGFEVVAALWLASCDLLGR
jgi:hypothetical protein